MKEIKLTQGRSTFVDDEDYHELVKFRWVAINSRGKWYATLNVKRNVTFMHRKITHCPKGLEVDHINGDSLDNRKENLRICTHAQNGANRKKHNNGTNKYKGVHYIKRSNRYRAQICVDGISIHLGCFRTDIEAANAYNKAATSLFKGFARVNIVKENI